MPNAGIIINTWTHTPDSEDYEWYSQDGYRKYLEDDKQHEISSEKQQFQHSLEVESNLAYISRTGVHENKGGESNLILFDKTGIEYNVSQKQVSVAKNSNIYSIIISFGKEVSKSNNISLVEAKKIAQKTFQSIMQTNAKWGFNSNYFDYDAALHKNTDHSHIHMRLYQKSNSPTGLVVNRQKQSLLGINQAKIEIAKDIPGLKEKRDVFKAKKHLEKSFREYNKTEKKNHLNQEFNDICKEQASLYKLFSVQPREDFYIDKQGNKQIVKGLRITYDNLSVPIYSLKDLKDVKSGIKQLNDCEKKIQPEQFSYKNSIDNYSQKIILTDKELNSSNKEFLKYSDSFLKDRIEKLAGNEKDPNALDSMQSTIKYNIKHRIFDDLAKNLGNNVIKTVTIANRKRKDSGERKTAKSYNFVRKLSISSTEDIFIKSFQNYHKLDKNSPLLNLVCLDDNYLIRQLKTLRYEKALEQEAEKLGISIKDLKELQRNRD